MLHKHVFEARKSAYYCGYIFRHCSNELCFLHAFTVFSIFYRMGRVSGHGCCVPGCSRRAGTNLTSQVKLFCFPSKERYPVRHQAWIRAIRRDQFTPTKDTRVCNAHFRSGTELWQYIIIYRILGGIFPTVSYDIPRYTGTA
jgi:hypothetical protein